jgi:hypothetical protein
MKRCTVLGLVICLIGCTTLQPVTGNPAAVQQRIASGTLLKRGDHILVLTKDGRTRDFDVTSTSASTIEGRHESISIDQIVSIRKRKFSVKKTALAVGLTVIVAAAAAVAVVAVCSAGGCRSSTGRVSRRSARFAQPLPPPSLVLPARPQNSQLQRCDGPSGESKSQEDDGESARARRCTTQAGKALCSATANYK